MGSTPQMASTMVDMGQWHQLEKVPLNALHYADDGTHTHKTTKGLKTVSEFKTICNMNSQWLVVK